MLRLMSISTIMIRLSACRVPVALGQEAVFQSRSPNIMVLPPPRMRGMKKVVTDGMNTIVMPE
jgi:hypothetical protein